MRQFNPVLSFLNYLSDHIEAKKNSDLWNFLLLARKAGVSGSDLIGILAYDWIYFPVEYNSSGKPVGPNRGTYLELLEARSKGVLGERVFTGVQEMLLRKIPYIVQTSDDASMLKAMHGGYDVTPPSSPSHDPRPLNLVYATADNRELLLDYYTSYLWNPKDSIQCILYAKATISLQSQIQRLDNTFDQRFLGEIAKLRSRRWKKEIFPKLSGNLACFDLLWGPKGILQNKPFSIGELLPESEKPGISRDY